jgi:chromosome segregation protein
MLKALELRGFKSFADKTRFDFPPGITVIVGPNGSGKSNVVDAIKWVLGEQSAKSLRGQEMADVIFKGGAAGGRKPANTAEATIIFDNADGKLAVEATEVHVTRRVYRSGEGEYLVNRQACRLRDVKDLFRGTGVGTDAYSLIEQGKVDTLLAASGRDRRAIFEEAAGISRFKAKSIEAQRRLERVEQNLLRLSDIVEEVDHRLRTVRSQAAKARRYREYTTRLQELRTRVGYVDWRKLTEKLLAIEAERNQLQLEIDNLLTLEQAVQARSLERETELGLASEELRACEARLARNRERVSASSSAMIREHHQLDELDQEVSRHRRQLAAMSTRAGDLESELARIAGGLEVAESHHAQLRPLVDDRQKRVDELNGQLDHVRQQLEARRTQYVDQVRAGAELASQISRHQSQWTAAAEDAERLRKALEHVARDLGDNEAEFAFLAQQQEAVAQRVAEANLRLELAQNELAHHRSRLLAMRDELAELRGRRAGCRERADVLAELEARYEGVDAGVKDLVARAREETDGPLRGVRGLLAELVQVRVESAPMVDVALGDRSQHLVVADARLVDYLQSDQCRLAGRVGFLFLPLSAPWGQAYRVELTGLAGVIGRADQLGDTWFVDDLRCAFALRRGTGRDVRLVTRAGELVDTDGRLVVGPYHGAVGLVSRRSQLRELRVQIDELDTRIRHQQHEDDALCGAIEAQERRVHTLRAEYDQAYASLSEQRACVQAMAQRLEHVKQQHQTTEQDLGVARRKQELAAQQLETIIDKRNRLESSLSQVKSEMETHEKQFHELDHEREAASREVTAARVELAKGEQRLESLSAQLAQLQRDQEERNRARSEIHAQLVHSVQRRRQTQRNILHMTSAICELSLGQEADVARVKNLEERREALRKDRAALAEEIHQVRAQLREVEQQTHRAQLEATTTSHDRQALAQRLREDYDIDVAELQDQPGQEQQPERAAVDAEIHDLRRKISNIGAVNLDALTELEELEKRHQSLHGQYQDLVSAKSSLERIIHKINEDSRKLFSETLEAIRANFQELFRKVFGGGRADIRLEEGVDILESGIEVVATPPGKHSLSLSLLSGGERALAAVTLLLAIFQFRPSPFCVLDEVDGPLDEANIDRFVRVLVEFLDWTKFVIVTHSKKTMTAATTLYGITMQEPGVSKRVSVQFEDVTEDGHVRPEAIERQQEVALPAEGDGRGAA